VANSPPSFERPTGSITGFVGMYTQPTLLLLKTGLHPEPLADRE
jgi:hypothetical protein